MNIKYKMYINIFGRYGWNEHEKKKLAKTKGCTRIAIFFCSIHSLRIKHAFFFFFGEARGLDMKLTFHCLCQFANQTITKDVHFIRITIRSKWILHRDDFQLTPYHHTTLVQLLFYFVVVFRFQFSSYVAKLQSAKANKKKILCVWNYLSAWRKK